MAMSGSSHWAKIKHEKIAGDVAKGAKFDKMMRQIQFVAKEKGGDPHINVALEQLIQKAKSIGMRMDRVQQAIDKGLGKIPAPPMEARLYEAFLSGVSFVIEALTDSDQRTSQQLRSVLDRHHAGLAPRNACTVNFQRVVALRCALPSEDAALELADRLGAIDFRWTPEGTDLILPPDADYRSAVPGTFTSEFQWLPKYRIPVDAQAQKGVDALVKELEERDDVQEVFTNHEPAAA
jgi:transcriptional/translational regulatory protein YebC/TACO1